MVASLIFIIHIILLCLLLLMNSADAQPGVQFRFIGGRPTRIEDFPYVGSLRILQNETSVVGSGYICLATVISNRVLITSAVCIYRQNREDMVAVIGTPYLRGITTTMKIMRIADWRWHGLYTFGELAYNIGLVFTYDDIIPNHKNIGYLSISRRPLRPHSLCKICGFGEASATMKFKNPLYTGLVRNTSKKDCYKRAHRAGLICTYSSWRTMAGNADDLGGPVICNDTLAGVYIKLDKGIAINTDIYIFRKWINAGIYMHFNGIMPLRSICCQWLFVWAIGIYLASNY